MFYLLLYVELVYTKNKPFYVVRVQSQHCVPTSHSIPKTNCAFPLNSSSGWLFFPGPWSWTTEYTYHHLAMYHAAESLGWS